MFDFLFGKKIIGVDVGSFGIKAVELSGRKNNVRLENYTELHTKNIVDIATLKNGSLPPETIALALKTILAESKIKSKKVIFSVPDFAIFCTSFEIPPMPKNEVAGAISFNAAQYLTLPVSEVTLDWQVAPKNLEDKNSPWKVFLIAIPNQLIADYKNIAKLAGLELYALEAEMLGIWRALIRDKSKTICLIDIGYVSSTISIMDKGFLKESYSFDFSAKKLSEEKMDVKTWANPLVEEINDILAEFLAEEKRPVEEIYVTGGASGQTGLKEFLQDQLKKTVVMAPAFALVKHPAVLEKRLQEMSGAFSASVGVALGYFN